MGYIKYELESHRDIAFIDMKSFYASVECVERHLNPLTTSLCVMSRSDNSNGLILASSPVFKEVFGKSNVGRSYDLPFDIRTRKFSYYNARRQKLPTTKEYIRHVEMWASKTFIVPPRMTLYIEKNLEILNILKKYAPDEDIHPYSIDEGFIDLTHSLDYFIPGSHYTRAEKLDMICARIQRDIHKAIGVYSTVGMSNANPLLAKLALDNEAKKTPTMRANWSYDDVETKVWGIQDMTDFWGIGHRTVKRLNKLKIYSIKDLANADADLLKKEMGIIGLQLWFHANGVDESAPSKPYKPKSKGLGNSQVLPRDYRNQQEIEIVLAEMAEQVAVRLRRIKKKTTTVGIYIGFSLHEERKPINVSKKIDPTQSTKVLTDVVLSLFRSKYEYGAVRQVAVRYENLTSEDITIFSLFDDVEKIEKDERIEKAIDDIRGQFGFLAIQKASSLLEGSRVRERSKLVGGHAGGLDGLT